MPIRELKDQSAGLPEQPGVYLYYNGKGETLYVGGEFFEAFTATGHGVPFDLSTEEPFDTFPIITAPISTGDVDAVISDGDGGWYVAGNFTSVDGESYNRLIHILSTGVLDEAFNPNVSGEVVSLALSSDGNTL